jgi:transposase-like protein
MPNVLISLSNQSSQRPERPIHCPCCDSESVQHWGNSSRNIADNRIQETEIPRYRCSSCGYTFRQYPSGVDQASQSLRIRNLAALIYALGMSAREVAEIFQHQGIQLSHMTVWREGNDLVKRMKKNGREGILQRYSLDRMYLPRVSQRLGVVVAIDLGLGKRNVIGTINEYNPRVVKSHLETLIADETITVRILDTNLFEQARLSTL